MSDIMPKRGALYIRTNPNNNARKKARREFLAKARQAREISSPVISRNTPRGPIYSGPNVNMYGNTLPMIHGVPTKNVKGNATTMYTKNGETTVGQFNAMVQGSRLSIPIRDYEIYEGKKHAKQLEAPYREEQSYNPGSARARTLRVAQKYPTYTIPFNPNDPYALKSETQKREIIAAEIATNQAKEATQIATNQANSNAEVLAGEAEAARLRKKRLAEIPSTTPLNSNKANPVESVDPSSVGCFGGTCNPQKKGWFWGGRRKSRKNKKSKKSKSRKNKKRRTYKRRRV